MINAITPQRITRYAPPTELDQLPKGTICVVAKDGFIEEFEQQSEDSNTPLWVSICPKIDL